MIWFVWTPGRVSEESSRLDGGQWSPADAVEKTRNAKANREPAKLGQRSSMGQLEGLGRRKRILKVSERRSPIVIQTRQQARKRSCPGFVRPGAVDLTVWSLWLFFSFLRSRRMADLLRSTIGTSYYSVLSYLSYFPGHNFASLYRDGFDYIPRPFFIFLPSPNFNI